MKPTAIRELPPVPWVRERDVDLLLAELLSTEPSLVTLLISRALRRDVTVPSGVPTNAHAVVNYARPDAPGGAVGETDVLVTVEYPDEGGTLIMSIEDKVWAAPQRNQGERHRQFVESREERWGLAVLIGPEQWIDGHDGEACEYHLTVPLEEIAQWCQDRAFEFQASVFRQACVPQDFDLAPDLQDWHTATSKLLQEEFGLRLEPQRYVRTRNIGKSRPNRWASCEKDTLRPLPTTEHPWIMLKPASSNHTARAVIHVARPPTSVLDELKNRAAGSGLAVRITRAGTLLIERHVHDADEWSVAMPFDRQVPHIVAVGRAAVELRDWWNGFVP